MHTISFTKRRLDAWISSFHFSDMEWLGVKILTGAFVVDMVLCGYFVKTLFFSGGIPTASAATTIASRDTSPGKDTPPGSGTEKLLSDLTVSGLNPTMIKSVTRKDFSVIGRTIALRGGNSQRDNIQAFEYPDQATAMKEASLLAQRYSGSSRSAGWKTKIHIYARGDMAIFYMGDNTDITSSLEQTAGLSLINPAVTIKALTRTGQ